MTLTKGLKSKVTCILRTKASAHRSKQNELAPCPYENKKLCECHRPECCFCLLKLNKSVASIYVLICVYETLEIRRLIIIYILLFSRVGCLARCSLEAADFRPNRPDSFLPMESYVCEGLMSHSLTGWVHLWPEQRTKALRVQGFGAEREV